MSAFALEKIRVRKLQPTGHIHPASLFFVKFYWSTDTTIGLRIVCGCVFIITAELSGCSKIHKAQIFTI